ncbi:MAG TPA: SRPBCC domain-containing protein [Candidatus Binatia bacterium]|nr:SRPBCC domain-containing protein [Candidatus Binatia bacterium]
MPTDTATGLVLRRTYDAPRERVFAAWTSPQALRRFLGPGDVTVPDVQIDARTGGTYRIVMRKADGEELVASGVYREIRPPERIVCTWSWEEDDPALEKETLLTLEFIERGEKTELVLTHEAFRDATQRDNHEHGWTAILDQLGASLRGFAITGIDLSGYMVKDAPRAIAFYRDVLGLEPARVYPENRGAEYDLPDGTTFGLWGGGGNAMPFQASNGILFAVDDLGAALAELEARGIPVVREFTTPNCRMAAIGDTEGNLVFLHKRNVEDTKS